MRRGVGALGALLAVLVAITPSGSAGSGCAAGRSLYTVAHADDSILFQDPDLRRDIAGGRCVQTVFFTAGDAGLDSAYWRGREEGVMAAYAELSGQPNSWTGADAAIPGHPASLVTLAAKPTVSLVFLRLPDGQSRGQGFGSTGLVSLEKLWFGTVPWLRTVDGSSSYTSGQLVRALGFLIASSGPEQIRTLDFSGTFGDGDHSDHHAVAFFTRAAGEGYRIPHTLTGYRGYGAALAPPNLAPVDASAKRRTWFAYAPFDPAICHSIRTCEETGYADSWQRQYTTATLEQGGPIAPTAGQPVWEETAARSRLVSPTPAAPVRALPALAEPKIGSRPPRRHHGSGRAPKSASEPRVVA